MEKKIDRKIEEAADHKSGVAIDIADKENVTAEAVREYTEELNDNHAGDRDFNADAV